MAALPIQNHNFLLSFAALTLRTEHVFILPMTNQPFKKNLSYEGRSLRRFKPPKKSHQGKKTR